MRKIEPRIAHIERNTSETKIFCDIAELDLQLKQA